MKKIFYFIMVCLYALGVIGGIGYTCVNQAWVIAVGVLAVGVMAFPQVKKYVSLLLL